MDSIINIINGRITTALQDKQEPKLIAGLTEPVVIREGDDPQTEIVLPALIGADGECNTAIFDDKYGIGLYHKLNSVTYAETTAKGYGDGRKTERVADMSLIAYGQRKTINQYELEKRLHRAITGTRYNGKAVCSVTSSHFNRTQNLAGEFGGIPFFLQPDIFLIKINYKITTALPECINTQQQ